MSHKFKKTILFACIFASLGIIGAAQQRAPKSDPIITESEWLKFSPQGSGFSVLLPAEPKPKEQVLETSVGKVVNHGYRLEFRNVAYAVSYADFPQGTSDAATIQRHFNVVRDLATKSRATVESETPITLDGHVGREWIMTYPDGVSIRTRSYWVSPRLYIVLGGGKDPRPGAVVAANESIAKFFNSFSLTESQ